MLENNVYQLGKKKQVLSIFLNVNLNQPKKKKNQQKIKYNEKPFIQI